MEQQIYQVAEELRLNISDLAAILDGMAYPYAQEGQEVPQYTNEVIPRTVVSVLLGRRQLDLFALRVSKAWRIAGSILAGTNQRSSRILATEIEYLIRHIELDAATVRYLTLTYPSDFYTFPSFQYAGTEPRAHGGPDEPLRTDHE